ncbi:hypothetical protein QQZ08_010122 [Neonectria magnoliae]|uniref:Uncharacterized protein n=1 Tax=Neonectria magnoliae TaxID=2732573 RepID=A0ABR1HIU7_9HYPO
MDGMTDDSDFFLRARDALHAARGWSLPGLKSFRKVELAKFCFQFKDNDFVRVESFEGPLISSDPIDDGYYFHFHHDNPTLQAKNRDMKLHMGIVGANIRAGLLDPSLGKGATTVLNGIPKRQAPPLLRREPLQSGWCFHVEYGLSWGLVLMWTCVAVLFGLAFVSIWLSTVDKTDLQGAFGPANYVLSVYALALTMMALGNRPHGEV